MTMVGELDAVFPGDLAGMVVGFGGALPAIGLPPQRAINRANHEIGLSMMWQCSETYGHFSTMSFVVKGAGRRSQAEAIERGAGLFGIIDGWAQILFPCNR